MMCMGHPGVGGKLLGSLVVHLLDTGGQTCHHSKAHCPPGWGHSYVRHECTSCVRLSEAVLGGLGSARELHKAISVAMVGRLISSTGGVNVPTCSWVNVWDYYSICNFICTISARWPDGVGHSFISKGHLDRGSFHCIFICWNGDHVWRFHYRCADFDFFGLIVHQQVLKAGFTCAHSTYKNNSPNFIILPVSYA